MSTPEQTPITHSDVVAIIRRYALGVVAAFLLVVGASAYSANEASHASERAATAAALADKVSAESRTALVASGKVALVDGCNRDFRRDEVFRDLFTRLSATSQTRFDNGQSTQREFDAGQEVYKEGLRVLELPDCRVAENLLTADPNIPIPVVEPLYPKSTD